MENRPPQQETPRRPPTNSGRKTNGSGGSPTPPWLWLLLLGGFALIFWQFVPKTEVQVLYYPWFYEQVQADNIKSITIQGNGDPGRAAREQTTTRIRRRRPSSRSRSSSRMLRPSSRSMPIVQKHHPDQREEDRRRAKIGGRQEIGRRKKADRTSSRSIPSPPTRPTVWPGSCSCCRPSWSSFSSI